MRITTTRRCLLALVLVALVALIGAAPAAAASTDTTLKGTVQGYGNYSHCNHCVTFFSTKLVGATITVLGSSPLLQTTTDQGGLYCLTGTLLVSPYTCGVPVQACAPWYESQTVFVHPCPGGTRTQNFCLQVKPTTLTGKVVDCQGKPVSGASVCVARWSTCTKSNGTFALTCMRLKPQTQYTAQISKQCHIASAQFTSAPGGSANVNVTLK